MRESKIGKHGITKTKESWHRLNFVCESDFFPFGGALIFGTDGVFYSFSVNSNKFPKKIAGKSHQYGSFNRSRCSI
jgi:hypothetical protein